MRVKDIKKLINNQKCNIILHHHVIVHLYVVSFHFLVKNVGDWHFYAFIVFLWYSNDRSDQGFVLIKQPIPDVLAI